MPDDMYQDLDEPVKPSGVRVDISAILGTGVLASAGSAFVWMVKHSDEVQMTFENPIFMVMTFILFMLLGGLIVYFLHSRPRNLERLAIKRSLKKAVEHATQCDKELVQIKTEFQTVARFIDGYNPSFLEPKPPQG